MRKIFSYELLNKEDIVIVKKLKMNALVRNFVSIIISFIIMIVVLMLNYIIYIEYRKNISILTIKQVTEIKVIFVVLILIMIFELLSIILSSYSIMRGLRVKL